MRIGIIITNPNHHFEMTIEVAQQLKALGHDPFYISLCEMRRMRTPVDKLKAAGIEYLSQPPISEELKPSTGAKTLGSNQSPLRNLLRKVFWIIKLKPFVKRGLKTAERVLFMNDTAYPGDLIAAMMTKRRIPFHLLQEGIRFPLPGEGESGYGSNGARKLFVWGKRSAAYFEGVIKPETEVVVTGSPRFDKFLEEMAAKDASATTRTLGVFTNPIDDQGFCTKDQKMALFSQFVQRAAPYLKENEIQLGVKCHPREEIQEYLDLAAEYMPAVALNKDIRKAMAEVNAGVIMASTVGLELMGAGKPIGQLEIPGHGYVFDYKEASSTQLIPLEGDFELSGLFEQETDKDYFQEHINFGKSAETIAQHLIS